MKVEVSYVYRIHPVPHGLQRIQVAKVLRDWQWDAKPLQPARGTAEGGAWDIGASCAPPQNTMVAFAKDVLITLLRDKTSTDKPPAVVGPKRVQTHLQRTIAPAAPSSSSDPWLQSSNDPWKQWHQPVDPANGNSQPTTSSAANKRMDSLRNQLSTEIRQHLTEQMAGDGYTTENEQRFAKLETNMAELQAQGHQFRQWFEESGNKMASHDHQLTQIQSAIAQQQQDLTSVEAEVHSSADSLHQAMQLSFGSMKHDLTQELGNTISSQMDRLESLVTGKKARAE